MPRLSRKQMMNDYIIDPELEVVFNDLNKKVFNGVLRLPASLAFNYRLRTSAGLFRWYNDDYQSWIEINGLLKNDSRAVRLTLLHEMVHYYLFTKWSRKYRNLSMNSFIDDDSSMFIVTLTELGSKLGYTYDELASCDAMLADREYGMSQEAYVEAQKISELI